MGIESFFGAYINRKFNKCVQRTLRGKNSSLFIDCNGIFHNSAQRVYGYGEFSVPMVGDPNTLLLQSIIEKIEEIIVNVNPQDNFIIAPDGVAPMAKLNQQKSRRFLSSMERTISFDSNQFTPGTDLMFSIDEYIKKWLYTFELPPNTIYSSHLDKGEGEHKIFQFIRENKVKGNGNHILYGLDSDLIILSLLCPLKKIFLMREDYSSVINIDKLRELIKQEFYFTNCNESKLIKDFSVIVMFAGNDFLPKLPSFTETRQFLEKFTMIYKNNRQHIVDDSNNIDFRVIMKLFDQYNEIEDLQNIYYYNMHKYPYPELNSSMTNKGLNFNRFQNLWFNKQFQPKTNMLDKYYKNNVFYDGADIGKMCIEFLKTMNWVFKYYTEGHSSVSNTHLYPYIYAPTSSALKYTLNKIFNETEKMNDRLYKLEDIYGNNYDITPVHQLLMVLPPRSYDILPRGLKSIYNLTTCINPSEFVILQEGTSKDWHKTSIIPPVNLDLIRCILDHLNYKIPKKYNKLSPLVI